MCFKDFVSSPFSLMAKEKDKANLHPLPYWHGICFKFLIFTLSLQRKMEVESMEW
jgi:hypothetical protein